MSNLIDRQAAIDAECEVCQIAPKKERGHNCTYYVHGCKEIECLRALQSAQPEQRWIPCSERLPEDGKKHYWVCTDTGYQCECRWTNINHFWTDLTTDWHWHIMDIPQYSAVIAWMPLPEPYREEGEKDE